MGLPYNCNLLGMSFVGPILIVGVDGEEFASLPEDVLHTFSFIWKAT